MTDLQRAESRAEWMGFRHQFLGTPASASDWAAAIRDLAALRPPEPETARMSPSKRARHESAQRAKERRAAAQKKRDRRAGLARE